MASRSGEGGWTARTIGEVERRVRTYLADKAANGPIHVKTGRIADDLDLSDQRAGQAVAKLQEESRVLEVDRWSDGRTINGATWYVTNTGPSPYGRGCTGCARIVPEAAEDCPHCGRRFKR